MSGRVISRQSDYRCRVPPLSLTVIPLGAEALRHSVSVGGDWGGLPATRVTLESRPSQPPAGPRGLPDSVGTRASEASQRGQLRELQSHPSHWSHLASTGTDLGS